MPRPPFFNLLVAVATFDWLVGRVLTRSAISMPKTPLVIALYNGLSTLAIFATTLSSVLVLIAVGWLAWQAWQQRQWLGAALWGGGLMLSLVAMFLPQGSWLGLAQQALTLALIAWLVWHTARSSESRMRLFILACPTLALSASAVYHGLPALYTALHWPGPPPFTNTLFNVGELCVVLAPWPLWLALGRPWSWQAALWAALPAAIFVAFHFANPAMAGIIAVWSVGLTLYLPWPLYALALWLTGLLILTQRQTPPLIPAAFLLLLSGGYAPQLSTHAFFTLLALWALASFPLSPLHPTSLAPSAVPNLQSNPVQRTGPVSNL